MPIEIPQARRIICSDDERYTIPINIFANRPLGMSDELLLQEMTRYKPATKLREGDIVHLLRPPAWLERGKQALPVIPRYWKVRIVMTYWGWRIMDTASRSRGILEFDDAVKMLETSARFSHAKARMPMIFCTPFPHGKRSKTAAWLPMELVRALGTYREDTNDWRYILDQHHARYRGYEVNSTTLPFLLDLEPDEYQLGHDRPRPFPVEEPLVQDLYCEGLEEMLEIPYIPGERDKVAPLDPEHDVYTKGNSK